MRFLHDPIIDWRETVKHINPALAFLPPAVSTAQTLAVFGKTAEAEQLYQEILAQTPQHPKALRAYAELLQRLGRNQEASDKRRNAIEQEVSALDLPHEEAVRTVQFRQAIEGLAEAPPTAPAAYVAQRFDEYASAFEQHLTETLQYRTPTLVMAALDGALKQDRNFGLVFDGGCGTGLMGIPLRSRSGRLVGCDLSPGMIEQTRQKGIYDELHVASLEDGLSHYMGDVELLTIADVFPYLGDLQDVMRVAKKALRPGGWLAFSTERYDGEHYRLHTQGRYAHSETYLRDLAKTLGFNMVVHHVDVLRQQMDEPVVGHIMIWQA